MKPETPVTVKLNNYISSAETAGVALHAPKSYFFTPKKDISAYELALIMPCIVSNNSLLLEQLFDDNPDMKRHVEDIPTESPKVTPKLGDCLSGPEIDVFNEFNNEISELQQEKEIDDAERAADINSLSKDFF